MTATPRPQPDAFDARRLDAYVELMAAGHRLYQSVLALQFVDVQGDLPALREHLITELYAAADLYMDAYMKVNPKDAARPPTADD